jgi:hypothetical protein
VWLLDRRRAVPGTSTQAKAVEDSNVGNLRLRVPKGAQFMSDRCDKYLPGKQASMITILCIGVVTALAAFAFVLKTRASEPKKAQKAEKAAIMKQLLALSENENNIPVNPPSPSGTLRSHRKRLTRFPPKPAITASQPARPSPGRC